MSLAVLRVVPGHGIQRYEVVEDRCIERFSLKTSDERFDLCCKSIAEATSSSLTRVSI